MQTTMCDEGKHDLCDGHMRLSRINRACECYCHGIFGSPGQFLQGISKLSRGQKDRMLMDLAWKCWVRPPKLTMKNVALQSFRVCRLVP